ncbi:unnamed protein product [Aureobasidium uvarum]|uniref:non-specific serine/threonine protein kinase n=1 Tax=Aureobasidium uvarum TaxID=2773716 RepID=A0A9N8PWK3_9PEZI|nr:unnamed protein product [Aureobasidium uvarum]
MSLPPDPLEDESSPSLQLSRGQKWQWVEKLGEGGEAAAHLWARVDVDQKVVERVVIRNTQISSSQLIKGGPHDGEWRELHVQQRLAPNGSLDTCTVPILAVERMHGYKKGWRTYMHYYSKGDLSKVINKHTELGERPLPESFLWFVFHRMAKALVAMDETFREPGKEHPVIIHRDIKPSDILMGHPGSLGKDVDWVLYPPAYMGDFGFCYLTSNDNSWTKKLGSGTKGYIPPESEFRPVNEDSIPPSSKANVWGVGESILVAMMTRHSRSVAGASGPRYRLNQSWQHLIEQGKWNGYSADLIGVAELCVRNQPEERPTPQELLQKLEAQIDQHTDGLDRWGTLSWVKQKSRLVDGPLAADDAEDDDTDAGADPTTGGKRKASEPAGLPPDAKRVKAEDSVKRRLAYVATVIKGVRPVPKVHVDDKDFRLNYMNQLRYADYDSIFDPESFFDRPDPGPIEYFYLDKHTGGKIEPIEVKTTEHGGVVYIDSDDEDDEPPSPPC